MRFVSGRGMSSLGASDPPLPFTCAEALEKCDSEVSAPCLVRTVCWRHLVAEYLYTVTFNAAESHLSAAFWIGCMVASEVVVRDFFYLRSCTGGLLSARSSSYHGRLCGQDDLVACFCTSFISRGL